MRNEKKFVHKRDLLVCVIKRKSDLKLLLEAKSYRIPEKYINPIGINYIAFYFPSRIFKGGKKIEMYAKLMSYKIIKRRYLPNYESTKAGINEDYVNFTFKSIKNLKSPIANTSHMRVTFKRTEYSLLKKVSTLAQLYNVKPLEDIMNDVLSDWGKPFKREYTVKTEGGKYRLDFAILCNEGILGIECDSKKWHSSKKQSERDKIRDSFLEKKGLKLIHFKENEVIMKSRDIIEIIEKGISALGGFSAS
ncbi:TPA: hypothetical protein DCW38_01220 [candidate division WOR-3 bacterium]|uniref:Restriction endonuclease type II-like domain-containing protein n=1 Tax=candidate division WOR-3 bacterium TaxID=2052148 RepID=A0A350H8C2_UNCW3|nr:hypothetical protein [candidate division WOR-3 bacterium]